MEPEEEVGLDEDMTWKPYEGISAPLEEEVGTVSSLPCEATEEGGSNLPSRTRALTVAQPMTTLNWNSWL